MTKFASFQMPKTINYGRSALESVGQEAVKIGKKALIVSDNMMNNLGYVSKCKEYLSKEGIESEVYLGIESEPTDNYVAESLETLTKEKCDIVVSLGGGSCIDTAKSISVLATNGGYIGDYMGGGKIAKITAIPHIAIPTTAGTGSEATDVVVITNTSNDTKMMIKQPAFLPEIAIVDPILTLSSPKHVTAATGIDALSHAIEAYISRISHPMTDMMALSAIKLITKNIMTTYYNGESINAREAMSLGALQAGIAFSNSSVCLVHGMSRPIGALFQVPHGYSNAMLLPAVLEFSKESSIKRLADIGKIFSPEIKTSDDEYAKIAVSSVKSLCKKLDIPNLRNWGIDKQIFESAISKMATDALVSGSPANNPKSPSHQEIEELYRACYDYQFLSEIE